MNAPVALFIFNRPNLTKRVFAEIACVKPSRLLVIADGPRNSEEKAKCEAARSIIESVNWNCEVLTNYSDINLGCKRRVSSGLDWVFEQCEKAIILEDDCLPSPTFFQFCADLLEKYHHNEQVMMISGDNFQPSSNRTPYSYYFSRYAHVWGWAAWRRAWQHYDVDVKRWQQLRGTDWLFRILEDEIATEYWSNIFDKTLEGCIDTWDYQWQFACWVQNGLSILPNVNLISNIGFGDDSTHTKGINCKLANLPKDDIVFPLKHPSSLASDKNADRFSFKHVYDIGPRQRPRFFQRLRRRLSAHLPHALKRSISYIRSR